VKSNRLEIDEKREKRGDQPTRSRFKRVRGLTERALISL
jgi:hypothetical protein